MLVQERRKPRTTGKSMVPQDHLLRKIDAAISFKRIYEFVEELYCEDNDPVVLSKIVLIQPIYGIASLRRMAKMIVHLHVALGKPPIPVYPEFSKAA